jgi:two-component system, NarL family, sensor histidine kinase UhpB
MKTELKILMLEDETADAELIQKFLRRSGMAFRATIASDRPEFLAAIRNGPFDAILADNSLPQFDSADALKLLQKENIDSPFILVTGTVSEEFAVGIIQMGADDYILKNNLVRLPSSIIQAIEKRRIIREKHDAETALIRSEKRYRTLFQRNLAGIYQSTIEGMIIDCNNAFCKMLGYSNASKLREVPPRELYFSQRDRVEAMARLQYEKYLFNYETILRHKNGQALYVIENISLVEDKKKGQQTVEGITINITDRKKAEDDLRQSNRELHELSLHLQNIREEERIQIARDIHDELGQQLTGLKMDVYALDKQINSDDITIRGKFTDMLVMIEEIVGSVRKIAANLRPNMLDDLGLVAALKWQSQEVENRFGVRINFVCDLSEIDTPVSISTGLFRIYQEALTNAVRHANAHVIESSLKVTNNRILMDIHDDGKGMDQAAGGKTKSFGLLGIKERVFVMGGEYALNSAPGKGTSLTISVPV